MSFARWLNKEPRIIGGESPALINNAGLLGTEIELTSIPDGSVPRVIQEYWSFHVDSSVRATNKGAALEFTHTGGYGTARAETATNVFYNNHGRTWEASPRCGLHVHIDVLDLTIEQMKLFLAYAMSVDRALFNLTDSSYRMGTVFCRLSSEQRYHIDALRHLSACNQRGFQELLGSTGAKYSSINLSRLQSLGTVEFRHFSVPSVAEDLLYIYNLILSIRSAALGDTSHFESLFKDNITNLDFYLGL